MKKHPHHTLLPIHLQNALMSAATSGELRKEEPDIAFMKTKAKPEA